MESRRTKGFLGGYGCAALLAVLLVSVIACGGGWNFEVPEYQVTLAPRGPSGDETPVIATPSLIQPEQTLVPVGTPLIPDSGSAQNQEIV